MASSLEVAAERRHVLYWRNNMQDKLFSAVKQPTLSVCHTGTHSLMSHTAVPAAFSCQKADKCGQQQPVMSCHCAHTLFADDMFWASLQRAAVTRMHRLPCARFSKKPLLTVSSGQLLPLRMGVGGIISWASGSTSGSSSRPSPILHDQIKLAQSRAPAERLLASSCLTSMLRPFCMFTMRAARGRCRYNKSCTGWDTASTVVLNTGAKGPSTTAVPLI